MIVSAEFGAVHGATHVEPRRWDAEWAGLGEEVIVMEALERLEARGMRHTSEHGHEEHLALCCLALLSRLDDQRRMGADLEALSALELRARAAVAEMERMRAADQRRHGALVELIGSLERVRELLAPK